MARDPAHHLFFSRDIAGAVVRLDASESRHATRVLRLRVGDGLRLTDGTGSVYRCTVSSIGAEGVVADVVEAVAWARVSPRITLAVGLPERDRFELLVEHVTPLGVTAIVPLVCEFCQEQWWRGKWAKHAERLERKMVAAVKQSLNPFLPALSPPRPFAEALQSAEGVIALADEQGGPLPDAVRGVPSISAFVGPPGGFSPSEIDALRTRGALPVCLSPNRLRTELAATCLAVLLSR